MCLEDPDPVGFVIMTANSYLEDPEDPEDPRTLRTLLRTLTESSPVAAPVKEGSRKDPGKDPKGP